MHSCSVFRLSECEFGTTPGQFLAAEYGTRLILCKSNVIGLENPREHAALALCWGSTGITLGGASAVPMRACRIRYKEIAIHTGIPQRFHLGPLIFNFINGISKVFPYCKLLCYAGDLNIHRTVASVEDANLI